MFFGLLVPHSFAPTNQSWICLLCIHHWCDSCTCWGMYVLCLVRQQAYALGLVMNETLGLSLEIPISRTINGGEVVVFRVVLLMLPQT